MATTARGMASDDAVHEATGRHWDEWFAWLHQHGAEGLDHKGIVQLLDEEAELDSSWWRQQVTVTYEQHAGRRRVGQVADGTFQIGTRRTFRSSPARAWQIVASTDGAAAWLGDAPDEWWYGRGGGPVKGDVLTTPGGERYEVRGISEGERIRLRTLGPLLPPTTIQLNVIPERGRSVINLHQEGIPDEPMREAMRDHWKRALDRLGALLDEE